MGKFVQKCGRPGEKWTRINEFCMKLVEFFTKKIIGQVYKRAFYDFLY